MRAPMMQDVEQERPSREVLVAMFRDTASEIVEKDFHQVVESTSIGELAIDSLGMLEIIGSLERRLRVQIPDDSLTGLQTIGDLIDIVEQRLARTA